MVTKTGGARFAPLPAAAFAALAAFAVSAAVSPARAEFANPHGVAVVIGNRDYEHRDVPDVTFAHRDADAFSRYVVEVLGYDPEHVLDLRDATRRELFDALGTRSGPHNSVLFGCGQPGRANPSMRPPPGDGGALPCGAPGTPANPVLR